MPKSKAPYPAEVRRRMVELVRAGRGPRELAREYEPSSASATGRSRPIATRDGARTV